MTRALAAPAHHHPYRERLLTDHGPYLVALVRAGAKFDKGELTERPDQTPAKEPGKDATKVAA